MKKSGLLKMFLAFGMAAGLVLSTGSAALATDAKIIRVEYGALNVATPSQQDIINYLTSHRTTRDNGGSSQVTFSQNPNLSPDYSPVGSISEASKQEFLNVINSVRYIAGIGSNISWNDGYANLVQSASMVGYVNDNISHDPVRPANMNESVYQAGREGCGAANLSWWTNRDRGIWGNVIASWMKDDGANLPTIGHRRWILNPTMAQTAYGCVKGSAKTYTAMYTRDKNDNSANNYATVAWPAQMMPTEYFGSDFPWSVSFGREISVGTVVTLTHRNSGRTWRFSSTGSDGEFYVNNERYGQKGCVIFRPSGITINSGDIFDVNMSGLGTLEGGADTCTYSVNFFSLGDNVNAQPTVSNTSQPQQQTPQPANSNYIFTPGVDGTIYRLLNTVNNEHLYTTDKNECRVLISSGSWIQENSPGVSAKNGTPVYRLFNSLTGEHLYSADKNECSVLSAMYEWSYDNQANPIFYGASDGTKPVFRIYNHTLPPIASHHYTSDMNEVVTLVNNGWVYDNNAKPVYQLK